MSGLIISVSGLRGIIGTQLTPEIAGRFACAYADGLGPGEILLTRDGRTTGPMLVDAIRAALSAVGRTVIDAGIAATPTHGLLIRHWQTAGGIQVSASHNPPEYNGMKLFDDQGCVLSESAGHAVIKRFHDAAPDWAPYDHVARARIETETTQEHADRVLATVDTERIKANNFCVLLDSNHGAGSLLGRRLLDDLGCRLSIAGGEPDGQFAHPPEPTRENLREVGRQVVQAGADIGFCQDPDADRLAVIDEQGNYLGEELTLALCLDHVLRSRCGPVVINCATSQVNESIAAAYDCPIHRAPVGEANVVARMKQTGAVFGGEGNGGPIDPRVGYVRDSFVGMALILDALASRQLAVSALAAELPRYEIHKTKISLDPAHIQAALDALEAAFSDAEADRQDGLRLTWPDAWLLVRASNTEPIVRVIAESNNLDSARDLCRRATEVVEAI